MSSPDIAPRPLPTAISEAPQALALGITNLSWGPAGVKLVVPYKSELVGDPDTGVIAGGVVTTLLDQACGVAVFAALNQPVSLATLDLRIDYMRAAEPGCAIYAEAQCYKLTRTVAFVRATAYDRDAADPVATAQAAFMLSGRARREAVELSVTPDAEGGE